MYSARYSYPILIKLGFFSADFRKILKYQISWKSHQWGDDFFFPCERRDRRAERHNEVLRTRPKIAYVIFTSKLIALSLSVTFVLYYILMDSNWGGGGGVGENAPRGMVFFF